MANNWIESSSFVKVPKEKLDDAKRILERVKNQIGNEEEGYVGFIAEIEEDGVWIYHDESLTPEHVEFLVRTLVDELDLPGIHMCSWSYTCSKPRIDNFGGGAFAIHKGQPTVWVDATNDAHVRMVELLEKSK